MLSCSEYDYIEIVCMHNYPIIITIKTGETIECTALDTQRNEERKECIKVKLGGAENLIVLDKIAKLEITIENPHFNVVSFSS